MNTAVLVILLFLAFVFLSAMRVWNRFAVGFETKSRGEIERERELARERAARGEPQSAPTTKPNPKKYPGATVLRKNLSAASPDQKTAGKPG